MSGAIHSDNCLKSIDKSSEVETATQAELESLPRRFGRLTLLRQLARGGMGEVYLATSGGIEGAERATVVKIIRQEHKHDESFLARFLDEARIQSQLAHPGVAQVLEAARSEDGQPYVVVEHVEGRNLGEVRARCSSLGVRIGWPEAVALGISMGDALCHVHERTDAAGRPLSIVHRDLSPQNVMVSYQGDTKLIDFGTARGENRRCHTVSGVVFAKPGYVAPEVANQTPGAVPADLYAFGIMLWELVANRRFLSGDASAHLAQVAVGKRNPAPLSQITGAPVELDAIIAKLTAPSIADRYQSAREVTSDLVDVLKKAASLANGDRSVRGRISQLMQRLYPSEPARSRAEFARLMAEARDLEPKATSFPEPSPPPAELEASPDTDLLPGTRFKLVREIGRGGMGVVYEAYHIDLARSVAVKVLPTEHSKSAARMQQFRTEARALASLNHENLVKLFDFGVANDGRPFYAMELLEGKALDSYLEHHKGMDWREAVGLGVQACRALEVAHAAGVIHRDIKPANLFITRENVVKLFDFGIAKLKSEPETGGDDQAGSLKIIGTPEYLAPEQVRGTDSDERGDLYALGAVLYELVTGRLPHVAETTVGLLDLKTKTLPESPRQRAPQRGLPKMVDEVIMRSLKTDPSERFASAAAMREALEAALREPELQRKRRRRFGYAAVGTVMATLVAGGVLLTQKPELGERVSASVGPIVSYIDNVRNGAAVSKSAQIQVAGPAKAQVSPPSAAQVGGAEPVIETVVVQALEPEAGDDEMALGDADVDIDLDAEEAKVAEQAGDGDAQTNEVAAAQADSEPASESEAAAASDERAPELDADVEARLVQAEQQMQEGNRIKAYHAIKRLAWTHPKHPQTLRAYSLAAVRMKAWGEAHRAAYNWAQVDESAEAQLQLAKMERATSRGNYRSTLKKLLAEHPDNAEAAEMLGGKEKAVARAD